MIVFKYYKPFTIIMTKIIQKHDNVLNTIFNGYVQIRQTTKEYDYNL